MTAISAFLSEDAVHVFSDGAWHDPSSGRPCGIGTKVHAIPEHNAVFAVTGVSTILHLLSPLILESTFADYASLAEGMPDLIKACYVRASTVGLAMTGRCDVVLAGWSENAGPSIFLTECVFELDIFKGSAVQRYIRPSVDGTAHMHFPRDGLQLLEKQRSAKFSRPGAGTFGGGTIAGLVGGFAQHTRVGADGILIKVLKRWPDRVGESPASALHTAKLA